MVSISVCGQNYPLLSAAKAQMMRRSMLRELPPEWYPVVCSVNPVRLRGAKAVFRETESISHRQEGREHSPEHEGRDGHAAVTEVASIRHAGRVINAKHGEPEFTGAIADSSNMGHQLFTATDVERARIDRKSRGFRRVRAKPSPRR